MSDQDAKPKADDAESLSTAGLERGFDDHWALVRHGNPALAANVFAEALARAAWDAATTAEREACAKVCEHLWQEEAEAAVNGTQEPKYHDAIECAYAIRLRSNALGEGRERGILREASSGEAATSTDGLGGADNGEQR